MCPDFCDQCLDVGCIKCSPGYKISDKNNFCVLNCDSDQYIDSTTSQNYCRTCKSLCQTCIDSTSCQVCKDSYYLSDNVCLPCYNNCKNCSGPGKDQCIICLNNYYLSVNTCLPCDNTCYSCSGPGKDQCIQCLNNNQFISEKLNNICDPNCDLTQGQYIDQSIPNQKHCKMCISYCKTCSNSTSCQACIDNYFLSENTCLPCDNTCQSCSGPGKDQCIQCLNNNQFISEKLKNVCDPNCDLTQGQYIDQSNPNQKHCKMCISYCKTCSNSTSCQTCMDKYYLSGNICLPCDSTCQSCLGPGNDQCIQCLNNNYFISEKLKNVCDPNCDLTQGQYIDLSNPSQQYCKKCVNFCKTCSNSSSCQICMDNYYLSGNTCSPCHQSCKNCFGSGINQCTICNQSTYYIQPDQNNQCVQSCNINNAYFVDQLTNPFQNYCRKCLSTCKSCSNGNFCDTCFDKNYLDSNNQCQPCDLTCQSCNGTKNINCLICRSDLYFQINTNLCVKTCDSNEFLNILSQCQKCDQSCKTCNGSTSNDCKTCYSNFYLFNKTCVPVCPNGYSLNTNTLVCESCQDKLHCNNCYKTCQLCTLAQIQSQQCNTCYSETRILDQNNQCVCLNQNDKRNIFYQCSYQNIAVLNATLSENIPQLKIDFGSPLKQIIASPNQLCMQVFQDQTITLLGSDCQCLITDSQLIVSLTDSSSIMENDVVNFKSGVLQFQDYNVFIDTFYHNQVYQNATENPLLQFQNNFIENTCNPIIISLNQLKNDAGRGFYSLTWSLEELTGATTDNQIQSIYQLMQTASNNLNRTLILNPSYIPPNQNITIKFSYLLKMILNLTSDNSISQIQQVSIDVLISNLYLSIVGGSNFIVSYQKQFDLNSEFRDYEVQDQSSLIGVNFTWQCKSLSSDDRICYDYNHQKVQIQQGINFVSFPERNFQPYSIIVLQLEGQKGSRSANFSATCIFTELDIPPLTVQSPSQQQGSKINLNQELNFNIQYDSCISSDILSYAGALLYQNKIVGTIKFDYYLVKFRIWNYFQNIDPSNPTVQVRFSVYNPSFVMPSLSTISLLINIPPKKCILSINPTQGVALQTIFSIQFSNCVDEDLPLTYQFFYYNSQSDYENELVSPWNIARRLIKDQTTSYMMNTALPQGNLVIMSQVMDSQLGISNSTLNVQVNRLNETEDNYYLIANQIIQQSLQNSQTYNEQIVQLSIVGEELSKSQQYQASQKINDLKAQIITSLQQKSFQLPQFSLLSTYANKVIAQLQQTLTDAKENQRSSIYNQLQNIIKNTQSSIQNNNSSSLQQNNDIHMQNLIDSFKILNSTVNLASSMIDFENYNNISFQIGNILSNSTLPTQGQLILEGNLSSILSDTITQKNIFRYAIPFNDSDSENSANQFSIVRNTYKQNIYENTTNFQNYVKQFQNQNSTSFQYSKNKVITTIINSTGSNSLMNNSRISFQFNNAISSKNYNMTCLQQNDVKWSNKDCSIIKQADNNYFCLCKSQSPTTIIEDVGEMFFQNKNLDTVLGQQGIQNIAQFNQFYEYAAFWVLSVFTAIEIFLFILGKYLDNKKAEKIISQVCPEEQIKKQARDQQEYQEQAQVQNPPQLQFLNEGQQPKVSVSTPPLINQNIPCQLSQNGQFQNSPNEMQSIQSNQRIQKIIDVKQKRDKFKQLFNQEKQSESSFKSLSQNQIEGQQNQITKQSIFDQDEKNQQKTSQNQIIENLGYHEDQINKQSKDQECQDQAHFQTSPQKQQVNDDKELRVSESEKPQINQNIESQKSQNCSFSKSPKETLSVELNQRYQKTFKVKGKGAKFQELQNFENELQIKKQKSSHDQNENILFTTQKTSQNEIIENQDHPTQATDEKQQGSFQNISYFKRIVLFHQFLSIFYLYDQKISRSTRFTLFYIKTIHTLSISLLFSQYKEVIQLVVIALINSIILGLSTFFIQFTYKRGKFGKFISIVFQIGLILTYFYITLAISSGKSVSDSNDFMMIFILSLLVDMLFTQVIVSFFMMLLVRNHFKNNLQNSFLEKLFNLFQLKQIIEMIDV